MSELSTASTTPRVQLPIICQSYGMSIPTCNLTDYDPLQQFNLTWRGLIRVAFYICWKILHTGKPKLSTGTCSPAVHIAFDVNSNCVTITTGNLVDTFVSKLLNFQRIRLRI